MALYALPLLKYTWDSDFFYIKRTQDYLMVYKMVQENTLQATVILYRMKKGEILPFSILETAKWQSRNIQLFAKALLKVLQQV